MSRPDRLGSEGGRKVCARNRRTDLQEKSVIYSVDGKVHEFVTKPLEEQAPNESLRCVWHGAP